MNRYVSIFVRTFAQLALASLIVIQVPDVVDNTWIVNTSGALGLALVAALVGSLAAVLWAAAASPAASAMEKALRSAAEKAAGILGALVFNTSADLVATPKILVGGVIGVALAFVVTYLSYVPQPDPTVLEPVEITPA